MFIRNSTYTLLCLLCVAQCANSQEGNCLQRSVVVNAFEKHGQILPSLQPHDFRGTFGGKDLTIQSLSRASAPSRVVILFDKSGSMESETKRKVQQFIVSELVQSLPANTQFAVVAFGSRVLETMELGHSRADVLSAVNRFAASPGKGKTAVRDAQLYASDLLGPAQVGDSVVVVSDGQDNQSKNRMSAVQQAYWSKGIRMFLFEIVDRYFHDGHSAEEELFSTDSGGAYLRIEHPETSEILSAVRQIGNDLSDFYVLQLGLPQSAESPTLLQLEIVDASGRKRKDVTLTFPKKIRSCGTA